VSTTNRRIGVGLISVGWMGQLHTRAYRSVPIAYPELGITPDLVVAADSAADRAAFARDVLGYTRATTDYRDICTMQSLKDIAQHGWYLRNAEARPTKGAPVAERKQHLQNMIDVLRHGIKHGPHHLDLFYGTPSPGNVKAAERFAANRFSITRQLRYSRDETRLALDLCLFINGLPIATFELKNSLTKQTVEDAVEQYKRDRDPRELLFQFGRCIVHFAVDDHEVRMCTYLQGKNSWFLPFNRGWNDGAGNPPNPEGLKTDYLWKRMLTTQGLTDILENYAQIVERKDKKTGRKKREQIFPRYHQLDVVRRLLAATKAREPALKRRLKPSAKAGRLVPSASRPWRGWRGRP